MSEDDGRKIIDAVQRAAFSVEDRRESDTLKALNEMVGIAAEMMVGIKADLGPRGDVPPEERMRREATLIAKWPEACRRAGIDIYAGLQIALPWALIGAVIGEMIASDRGMGYQILHSGGILDSTGIFAGLVVLMFAGLALTTLIRVLEKHSQKWRPKAN